MILSIYSCSFLKPYCLATSSKLEVVRLSLVEATFSSTLVLITSLSVTSWSAI